MAFFKKKNQSEEKAAASSEKDFDYKTAVLEALGKKLDKGNLYDGCLIMPRGFTIDVKIGRHDVRDGVHLLQAVFIVNHDDFDEPLIDPVDAQGKTGEEAAKMAVDIFHGGVWHPLDQAIYKKSPIHIPVTYLNQHYDFDMYAQSIVRIGVPQSDKPTMLLALIQNEIPKYLGSKKYYWFRIYLAKHKDREIIEIRVNGSVCVELEKFFKPYINSWNAEEAFICEKQYGIFVQRGDDQCPFKKEAIVNGAKFVLEKIVDVKSREEYIEMAKELDEIVGDKNAAAEVRIFVPEIMAKFTLGYQEGDSLFLLDGENKIEFKKTQLRSYFYVQQVVLEFLNAQPAQEIVQNIVGRSVAFRELRNIVQKSVDQAKAEGKEPPELSPKDMYVPGTAYNIGNPEYKPW